MNTTSAPSRTDAALGGGSKVCEFVPSGTRPVITVPVSPTIEDTMLVIGATVVTIFTARSATTVPDTQF